MAKEKKPSGPHKSDAKADSKADLVMQLEEVAQFMEILGENDFKVRAFRKGADAVRATESTLEDIASGAVKIAGVGDGLKGAMREFLENGQVTARGELAAKIPPGVLELMQIPGLGPKKALLVQKELGISSVGELEYACRENRLVTLKGFGPAIQEKILKAIVQINSNVGKYRLDEAVAKSETLEAALRKHLGKTAEITRVGAIGRHAEIVESIEVYFSGTLDQISAAVGSLQWQNGLEERRASPFQTEVAGLTGNLSDGTRVTLWVSEERPDKRTLLWLCADDAIRDEFAGAPAEFEGFEASWLETEWFDAKRKPADDAYRRARDGGVKGVFHCHTDFSDGAATLEQMVRAAEKRGYEYIGISDHSQSAFYAQGLKPERILQQHQMIQELQKKVKIKIFHGIESDILQDGALDYEVEILAAFDFIVGSIHSRFKMDEPSMTSRIVRALDNPHITMWGHPTGRLLLGRQGYELNWDEVLEAAVANNVAIEFNANPHRLDVDWRLGAQLETHKARVCINPDAHSVDGLDDTEYGEYMAEKAMIPRGQILNLMPVDQMEKYLWERKQRLRH